MRFISFCSPLNCSPGLKIYFFIGLTFSKYPPGRRNRYSLHNPVMLTTNPAILTTSFF